MTKDGHIVPHADRVVSYAERKECRWCASHIAGEENYLGEATEPVAHIGCRCTDCGFEIAELLEDKIE